MTESCVLIIDDTYDSMEGPLGRRFKEHGYRVAGSIEPSKALSLISSEKPDVILLDIFFPGGELGKPTLEKIKKKYPTNPPVIMISETMHMSKYNAQKYQLADARLPKELFDTKEGIGEFVKDMNDIIESSKRDVEFDFVVGNTKYMNEKVVEQIRLVADTGATVLITGETGTGKEEVANAIKGLSKRKKEPFICLNCVAFPDNLIESEFFGYKKGAFTGAERDKPGRVALADKGTLFLDEIGDITPALQGKLLRLLRGKEYQPLGGTETIKADVRFIAATSKSLSDKVTKGEYRQDLYYRLNVFHIHLPPLRERKEDIPLLAKYFIEKGEISVKSDLRDDVEKLLLSYDWPGNIGELENMIESAVILAKRDKILQPIHFPELTQENRPTSGLPSDVPGIVDRIFNKEWNWENIKAEYAAKGEMRKKILLYIIDRWREKHGQRPIYDDLAKLLSITTGNVRRIYSEEGINLTKLPMRI